MASILQQIANPPGSNFPERLSDLKTARAQREQAQAVAEGQNLQNARARLQEVGRSAKALLDTYYPEGQEQPTNPAQAAKDYFKVRDRLVNQMGVPEDAVPNRIPRRSELQQAFEQAQTIEQQMAAEKARRQERLSKSDMVKVNIDGENRWVPAAAAIGLPTKRDPEKQEALSPVPVYSPSLSDKFPQGFTAYETPRGLMRFKENEEGQRVLVPAPSDATERTVEGSTEDVGMTSKTEGDLEEEILKAERGLQRLQRVKDAFRPEYQQSWNRIGYAWDAAKDKAGVELTDEEEGALSDFSAFKQEAINNINLYIKEITGAQMSEAEAERLRKGVPDPGEGIFDGDSPTQFRSKMNNSIEFARAVRDRAQYARRNGLMDELREKSQQDGELGGELDIDNFLPDESDDEVDQIINEALGE